MEILLISLSLLVVIIIGIIASRIAYVETYNASTVSKANKLGDPDLCCCGSALKDHSWGDNHAFVSEMEYFIESNHKRI